MSGLPVSHVGEKISGDVIATGSPTVHVGSSGVGMADRASACVPNIGQPVNPMLGCKLLPEEIDFSLTAPDTFSFGRGYLSSNPRVGKLGQGWWLPGESMSLELDASGCVLIDAQGRRIAFPALDAGRVLYSGSEQIWLRRGGVSSEEQVLQPWKGRWAPVAPAMQANEGAVLLLTGNSYLCFLRQSDGVWRLRSTFGRNGYLTEFGWSRRGFLTSVRDSAGRSYSLVYCHICEPQTGDDGVRLCGVVLANIEGPIPQDFDPQAPGTVWLVRYEFNDVGDLIAVRDRLGKVVRVFAWNNHIMSAHGEPGGLEVRYTWDIHEPQGRVVKQSETDGLVREFRYHADATDVIDSMGRTDRYEFSGVDGERRWTALVRTDGSRTEFDYDLFGRLVVTRDPLGRESRRRLDGQGRLLEEESPGKNRYRKTLDEETGLLRSLVDSTGRSWEFERDERANLTCMSSPGGTIHYSYEDPALPDRPTRIVDSKGGVKILQWNRLGLPVKVTDCSGQTFSYEYDREGRLVTEIDPAGLTSRRTYDLLGQLEGVTFADGASLAYRYDAQGRQIHIADAHGHCTQFFWDRNDRLLRAVDSAGHELHYLYDAAGRLRTLTNQNGAQARFSYDELDRLIEEIGFDERRQCYLYNLADELMVRTDSDQRETHYQYNRDGRVISCGFSATASSAAFSEHYSWLPDGRLAGVKGPDSEVRFAYDNAGNLCLENQIHADGWVYSVEHHHDELGTRESSRYGDAPVVNWLTYGVGHLHGVVSGPIELAFERDPLHRELRRGAHLKGASQALFHQQREYDPLGRVTKSILTRPDALDWQRSYGYDALGQLTHIDDSMRPGLQYDYDLSGRLIASRRGRDPDQRYHFDPAGNRLDGQEDAQVSDRSLQHEPTELFRSGFTDSYRTAQPRRSVTSASANRVEVFQGSTYHFDAGGNLIERKDSDGNRLLLAYDGANRLIHLVRHRPDGLQVEARYRYDALSRRITKTVVEDNARRLVRYGWDGERQCAEAFEGLLRTTVHEPDSFVPLLRIEQTCEPDSPELMEIRCCMAAEDQPLPAQCRPTLGAPKVSFFHTDHIGTPLQLSDNHGRVTWQALPDDWRAVTAEKGSADQPIRFQGQYHDEESGLYYNRHRYYLPEIGRYASQDPIGYRGGPNPYVYALNAPSVAYDPSGLIVPLIVIGGLLAKAALGAAIEVGMQAGKQIGGQMKDNWDNERDLTDVKWRCVDINFNHVALSGGFGAIAPGLLTSAKTIFTSGKALKALSDQAANTVNRAAKLVARKAAHRQVIKGAVETQAVWQTTKLISKCLSKEKNQGCDSQ